MSEGNVTARLIHTHTIERHLFTENIEQKAIKQIHINMRESFNQFNLKEHTPLLTPRRYLQQNKAFSDIITLSTSEFGNLKA